MNHGRTSGASEMRIRQAISSDHECIGRILVSAYASVMQRMESDDASDLSRAFPAP